MSATSKSFCVGPHFSADQVVPGVFQIKCRGTVHGTVKDDGGEGFTAWTQDGRTVDGKTHSSLRQAGLAVLKLAGVKSDLDRGGDA